MKKLRRKKKLYSKKWNRRREKMYFEETKMESTNHQQVFLLFNSFLIDEGRRVTRIKVMKEEEKIKREEKV